MTHNGYFLCIDQMNWYTFVQHVNKTHPHNHIGARHDIMIDHYGFQHWRTNLQSNMDIWFKDMKSMTEFSDLIDSLHMEETLRHL